MNPDQYLGQFEALLSNARAGKMDANQQLEALAKQNFALYLATLARYLQLSDKSAENRALAAIMIRNALRAKDAKTEAENIGKWLSLPDGGRNTIKQMILQSFNAPDAVRMQTARTCATIGVIEMQRDLWPDLIDILVNNVKVGDVGLRQATLSCLGYLCEELEEKGESYRLEKSSTNILTAILSSATDKSPVPLRKAALTALNNALEFSKPNFEQDAQRTYIIKVIVESCVDKDEDVRICALECLVRVADTYYQKLQPYMRDFYEVTIKAISQDTEKVALQAIEFWSTICDVESDILDMIEEALPGSDDVEPCHNYINQSLDNIVPLLLKGLLKQSETIDEDTWNLAMASATCLGLVAVTVGNPILGKVIPWIQQHLKHNEWRYREAAAIAFGSIIEGPDGEEVEKYCREAIPPFVQLLVEDSSEMVKDTVAWTLGRISDFHPITIKPHLEILLRGLEKALKGSPRVASHACWAIHNICQVYADDCEEQTSPLSKYFQWLLQALINASNRDDVDEENLILSVNEAMCVLINAGALDTLPIMKEALEKFFINRFAYSIQTTELDDEEKGQLQAHLCIVLMHLINRLGKGGVSQYAKALVTGFLGVFTAKSTIAVEEAMMGIGALIDAIDLEFGAYLAAFFPFLLKGLQMAAESAVFILSIGVVSDLCRTFGNKLDERMCDEVVRVLLTNLQNNDIDRMVKPPILSTLGDIALAIGGRFGKYLPHVIKVLHAAAGHMARNADDEDEIEYVNKLREGIFECYTGIVQGLSDDNKATENLIHEVKPLVTFMSIVWNDPTRSDYVKKAIVGLIGDITTMGEAIKQFLCTAEVERILSDACQSGDVKTQTAANWAIQAIRKL